MKIRFALFLLIIFSRSLNGDDWTVGTGGKPARYGLSTEHGPIDQTLLWQEGLPAVIARPAVIEGDIVAMDRIQDIGDVLHGTKIVAHDLTTGETLWTKDLPVEFPSTDWRNRVSAIRDGKVYATRSGNTNASYLYALNAFTGEIIWRSQDLIDESSTEGVSFSANGDLIVGNFTNIKRIDTRDGTTFWTSARNSPTSDGSGVAVSGGKGFAWEATGQGPRISVYSLDTGTRLYSSPGLGGLIQQVAPFVGPDNTVYATRTQNNTITDYLVAFADIDTALVEKWRVPLSYVPFSSFGVGPDGSVYSYSQSNRVIRIDNRNGSVMDSSEIILLEFPSQPRMAIDANGFVFVTNGCFGAGALYSFNPDLTLRWSTSIPNVNIGGPAIGQEGTMVVCGVGTDVRAYQGNSAISENKIIGNPTYAYLKVSPNPFHDKINIALTALNKRLNSHDSYLKVYDITGNLVRKIPCKNSLPINLFWEGMDYNGKLVAPGIYLLRFTTGSICFTKKIIKK